MVAETGVRVWRGIRFAEPPVAERRWQPPVLLAGKPTAENEFGPIPVQQAESADLGNGTMSEDCLTLNVWAPREATPEHPLPVMVWIYGGAYTYGSGRSPALDGTHLARDGVVLVTFNYRVGALGWLDLPELGPSNLGLRDTLAALTWVQDNIRSLGGDPDNVTVFGESAGAGIITSMLVAPAARGLFHAAISESSPATTLASRAMGRHVADLLLRELDLSPDELRDHDAAAIMAASVRLYERVPVQQPGHLAWTITVGDDLIPEDPVKLLRAGRGHPVPLLIGTNADEAGAFWISRSPVLPLNATGLALLFAEARELDPNVPLPELPRQRREAFEQATHACFRMPALWITKGHCAVAPTYLYRFDYAAPLLRLMGVGAGHTTEIPYVFGNFHAGVTERASLVGAHLTAHRISRRVQERWTGFARERRPDADGAPSWPRYRPQDRVSLVIDTHDRVVRDADARGVGSWSAQVGDLIPPVDPSAPVPPGAPTPGGRSATLAADGCSGPPAAPSH